MTSSIVLDFIKNQINVILFTTFANSFNSRTIVEMLRDDSFCNKLASYSSRLLFRQDATSIDNATRVLLIESTLAWFKALLHTARQHVLGNVTTKVEDYETHIGTFIEAIFCMIRKRRCDRSLREEISNVAKLAAIGAYEAAEHIRTQTSTSSCCRKINVN